MTKKFDLVGIGNAIVDVLAQVPDSFITKHNMRKGAMALITEEEAERIYTALPNPQSIAGGAVANSCVGVSSLGGNAAYIGKVHKDSVGKLFTDDIQKMGVRFATSPSSDGSRTARSMIVVTPDGQRTMNTYLGACTGIEKTDIDESVIANSAITFIEGYLWDIAALQGHLQQAAGIAHLHGNQVAFTLSDAWLIDRHRDSMRRFVRDHVDILLSNEAEITSFYQTGDLQDAARKLLQECDLGVITLSDQGSMIVSPQGIISIPAAPTQVVDTTGAGDLFAAGFLFGITQKYPLERCGKIAALAAAEIISHMGARPHVNLAELVQQKLALV